MSFLSGLMRMRRGPSEDGCLDRHRTGRLCASWAHGAGKTTTLRMITGLAPPDEGDIQVAGRSVARLFGRLTA